MQLLTKYSSSLRSNSGGQDDFKEKINAPFAPPRKIHTDLIEYVGVCVCAFVCVCVRVCVCVCVCACVCILYGNGLQYYFVCHRFIQHIVTSAQ